jgi:hypothetical protein
MKSILDASTVSERSQYQRNLMGRGQVQARAIEELLALPDSHPFKHQTVEHLATLQIQLQMGQNLGVDERGLVMNLSPVYEQWRQATLQEGEQRGWQTGQTSLVLRLLTRRVGELPDSLKELIQALSLPDLEELAEASANFGSVEDLSTWIETITRR